MLALQSAEQFLSLADRLHLESTHNKDSWGVDILPPKTGTGVEQAIVGKVGGGGDIGQAELLHRRQECKLQSGSVQWGPSAFYAEY